jgi:hypothetical protein
MQAIFGSISFVTYCSRRCRRTRLAPARQTLADHAPDMLQQLPQVLGLPSTLHVNNSTTFTGCLLSRTSPDSQAPSRPSAPVKVGLRHLTRLRCLRPSGFSERNLLCRCAPARARSGSWLHSRVGGAAWPAALLGHHAASARPVRKVCYLRVLYPFEC